MPELLLMPEIAANTTQALLSAWVVAEGAPFAVGDPLVTLETDKAVVDVEAESAGVVLKHLVAAGTDVEVGSPIAVLGVAGETIGDLDEMLAGLGLAAAASVPDSSEPVEVAPGPGVAGTTSAATAASTSSEPDSGGRVFASPLARRLAREAGIALDDLRGSGPGGRVRRRDVDAAILRRGPAAAAPATVPPERPATSSVPAYVDVPTTRLRRAIAARLVESKQAAPHFYLRGSARVDRLMAMRAELNAGDGIRVSVNDLVVKAVARAHLIVPGLNVIWTDDAVRMFSSVDVSVAVATEKGLVTPVLRGVERMSITEVAESTRDVAARAREGRLQQRELEGGSISVTNLGMFGTEEFAAIINPPQASILAVGAARAEAVVTDGALSVATVLRVTLSVDHRPVDGATAAEWMRTFLGLLEAPARILA
jgi:pyruvate dehydrogenase E2 component (dihydrolipoamide acetyltransferase)